MKNAILSGVWEPFPPVDLDETEMPLPSFRQSSVGNQSGDLDVLARELSCDFPLHSPTELRRVLLAASDDLWPDEEPTTLLHQARQRLLDRLIPSDRLNSAVLRVRP